MSELLKLYDLDVVVPQIFLSDAERKETQSLQTSIWSEGMRRLGGDRHCYMFPYDPKYYKVEMYQTDKLRQKKDVDLSICRFSDGNGNLSNGGNKMFLLELFSFNRSMGGYVMNTKWLMGVDGKTKIAIDARESSKTELEGLLKTIKR